MDITLDKEEEEECKKIIAFKEYERHSIVKCIINHYIVELESFIIITYPFILYK
jgi:hypothetical protein